MTEIFTTKHHAYVNIVNKSNRPISYVAVGHKYSDNIPNKFSFKGPIAPGEEAELDKNVNKVTYNTGIATTGRDWWVVTWCYEDGEKESFVTDPHNYRAILDVFEWPIHWTAWTIDFVTGGFLEKLPGWLEGIGLESKWLAEVCESATKAQKLKKVAAILACATIVAKVTNTATTSGFKQHILREDDSNKTTKIEIDCHNNVTFRSHSGKSETVSSRIKVPKLPDLD